MTIAVDEIILNGKERLYETKFPFFSVAVGNSFAFLQQQRDDEDEIARRGYKYALLIRNLITRYMF